MSGGAPYGISSGILGQLASIQYSQRAADQQLQNAFANAAAQSRPAPKPVAVRTPEEIEAQLQARMAELEAEAQTGRFAKPCRECRWVKDAHWCNNSLVIGFGRAEFVGRAEDWVPKLCGPEKALWEEAPIPPTLWQRLIAWFVAPLQTT